MQKIKTKKQACLFSLINCNTLVIMKIRNLICLGLPPIALLVAAVFFFGIFLIKLFWGWTIPAIFPLASSGDMNLIAAVITWGTAFKLSLFISVLVGLYHLTQGLTLKNIIFFLIGIVLVKLFWNWTMPCIFPKAVDGNLIAESISWWSAAKLSVFFTLLSSVSSFRISNKK